MSSCYAWQFSVMQNWAINNNKTPFISMQDFHNAIVRPPVPVPPILVDELCAVSRRRVRLPPLCDSSAVRRLKFRTTGERCSRLSTYVLRLSCHRLTDESIAALWRRRDPLVPPRSRLPHSSCRCQQRHDKGFDGSSPRADEWWHQRTGAESLCGGQLGVRSRRLSFSISSDRFSQQYRNDCQSSRVLHGPGALPRRSINDARAQADPSSDQGRSRLVPFVQHDMRAYRWHYEGRVPQGTRSGDAHCSYEGGDCLDFGALPPSRNWGSLVVRLCSESTLFRGWKRSRRRSVNLNGRTQPAELTSTDWDTTSPVCSLSLSFPPLCSKMAEELPSKVTYVRLGKSGLKVSKASRFGHTSSARLSLR